MLHDTSPADLVSFLKEAGYTFVTPTPATHFRVNGRPANQRAENLTDAFGWSRTFGKSLLPDSLFRALREGGIISENEVGWKSALRASTLDGDIFLHSAFPTIASDAVFFGPDTYRFARAIKSHLIDATPLERTLDIGCGSGAGGVVIAKNSNCRELVLTDINDAALRIAELNADAAGVSDVTTIRSDLFETVEGSFDLIVANPPYLNDPLERTYRHGGGELGSALSVRIAQAATERLSPGGSLILYTGSPIVHGVDRLRQAVEGIFAGSDLSWSYEEVDPDVFGEELDAAAYKHVDRIAAVVLTATSSGDRHVG